MLGAAVGLRKGYQVGIRSVVEKAPKPVGMALESVGFLFMFLFFGIMVVFGFKQTLTNMRQLSAAMRIPMAVPYMALPVGFLIMFSFTIEDAGNFILRVAKRKGA